MKTNELPPIHAGEILREEFMKPMGLSQNALACALRVPPRRINEILRWNMSPRTAPPAATSFPSPQIP